MNVKGWGDDTAPVWKYLKKNSPNCKITKEVWWNFEKVLVDKEGQVVISSLVSLPLLGPLLTLFVPPAADPSMAILRNLALRQQVTKRYASTTKPESIAKDIEQLLEK